MMSTVALLLLAEHATRCEKMSPAAGGPWRRDAALAP